jgi:hypothetical protein
MVGEPLAGRDPGAPEIVELGSVPGFVVFDLPGRVVAVSTRAGYIADPAGLDVEVLLALRRVHGDACGPAYPPA